MTDEEILKRLQTEEDFVFAPRYKNSVTELLRRYPDGVPDRIVAQALQIHPEEVSEAFERVVEKIRRAIRS